MEFVKLIISEIIKIVERASQIFRGLRQLKAPPNIAYVAHTKISFTKIKYIFKCTLSHWDVIDYKNNRVYKSVYYISIYKNKSLWPDFTNTFFVVFVIIRIRFLCKKKLRKLYGKIKK